MHRGAPYTYLSLWASISTATTTTWLWRARSHFFHKSAEGTCEVAQRLLKMQHQCGSHALFQDARKPSQDECGKTRDAREATILSERTLDQALLNLHPLALCLPEPETSRRAAY
ncbi:hypothetical protein EI555_002848 [Monodon monoceros]|uniref:Ferritin light chain n=1 Tax=Monodon monoceros TaxID=40151 RepID=A0A4U1EXE0_MONMO|nr:hypothetical protein EI555_002848 [Monodon monoceros]